MGLFGRLFRKSGDREGERSTRCMECGMTGGEHTDWCPALPKQEADLPSDDALDGGRQPEDHQGGPPRHR